MFNLRPKPTALAVPERPADPPPIPPTPSDLEALLVSLTKYGPPWLYQHNGTWCASVDMRTASPGVQFEVRSGRHPTPLAAVRELAERVAAALNASRP